MSSHVDQALDQPVVHRISTIFHTHGQTSAAVSAVRNDLHWILSLCQIPADFLPQTIQDGSFIRIDTQILMYNVQFPSSWTPHGQLITVGS